MAERTLDGMTYATTKQNQRKVYHAMPERWLSFTAICNCYLPRIVFREQAKFEADGYTMCKLCAKAIEEDREPKP